MFRSGNTIISNALDSFRKIKEELDAGISKSKEEREKSNTKLEVKREKFLEVERELNAKTAANSADIELALQVKENLDKLLTGKL